MLLAENAAPAAQIAAGETVLGQMVRRIHRTDDFLAFPNIW